MFQKTSEFRVVPFLLLTGLLGVFYLNLLNAFPDGRNIPFNDGVMSNNSCFAAGCHNAPGSTFNQVAQVSFQGIPEEYQPGQAYDITAEISGGVVYGLQVATVFADDDQAGTLSPLTGGVMQFIPPAQPIPNNLQILTHAPTPLPQGVVNFRWTAPAQAGGDIRLRWASNSANNDGFPTGDHIRTAQFVIPPQAQEDPDPGEEVVFYFPQFADARVGSVVFNSGVVLVNTGSPTSAQIDLFDSDGEPLMLTLSDLGTDSSFNVALGAGASISTTTPGLQTQEGVRVGYARVTTTEAVGGTVVFGRIDGTTGLFLTEAGVPATQPLMEFSFFVDTLGNRDTGVAMVNAGDADANLTLRLYDKDFGLIATRELELPVGHHLARFVPELFQEVQIEIPEEMEGTLTVESDQPVAALTLRSNDDQTLEFPEKVPTLTTFPVIPGRALLTETESGSGGSGGSGGDGGEDSEDDNGGEGPYDET